jgi:hypothetical protein
VNPRREVRLGWSERTDSAWRRLLPRRELQGREEWTNRKEEARQRLAEIFPVRQPYLDLERILWPHATMAFLPNESTPVVTLDSRGYRLSRLGDAKVASDEAPDGVNFVLGGSFAFGFGAADDWGTLPSALWRRSGQPHVNLGIMGYDSTQELISALPFVDRESRFIVCSGLNEFWLARNNPIDPLFGASFLDSSLRKLQRVSVNELTELVEAAQRGRPPRLNRTPRTKQQEPPPPDHAETIVATAARRQLRHLRNLRRLVPDDAEVVFALQPIAQHTDKELTDAEAAAFEAIDVVDEETHMWMFKKLFVTAWPEYVRALSEGCANLAVPFIDLSDATYTGWCYVDRVHMTERGHDIAAAFLLEAMT